VPVDSSSAISCEQPASKQLKQLSLLTAVHCPDRPRRAQPIPPAPGIFRSAREKNRFFNVRAVVDDMALQNAQICSFVPVFSAFPVVCGTAACMAGVGHSEGPLRGIVLRLVLGFELV